MPFRATTSASTATPCSKRKPDHGYAGPTLRLYEVLAEQVRYSSYKRAAKALGLQWRTASNMLELLRYFWCAENNAHLAALVYAHVGDIFYEDFLSYRAE